MRVLMVIWASLLIQAPMLLASVSSTGVAKVKTAVVKCSEDVPYTGKHWDTTSKKKYSRLSEYASTENLWDSDFSYTHFGKNEFGLNEIEHRLSESLCQEADLNAKLDLLSSNCDTYFDVISITPIQAAEVAIIGGVQSGHKSNDTFYPAYTSPYSYSYSYTDRIIISYRCK